MARSLGHPAPTVDVGPDPSTLAAALADDLARDPRPIAALAEAAARTRDRATATLLADAVERALPRLAAAGPAAGAVARMLLELDDLVAARRWAERALRADRLSVAAARLVHECNDALYALPAGDDHRRRDAA